MSWSRCIGLCCQNAAVAAAAMLFFWCAPASSATGDVCQLQLEVFINNTPTHLIGSFTMVVGGRIAARRAELEEVGLNPQRAGSADDMIVLDELTGLSYRYEEASQQIYMAVPDELRATKRLDASGAAKDDIAVRSGYGAVLNYTLYSAGSGQLQPRLFAFNGSSATLDARAFTPFGTLSQTGILRSSFDSRLGALRLDTTFSYSDRETLVTYRGGDVINGGLAWTRPIRIGGAQVQRNFALRPDLVTLPLPSVSGSAAVPSTVDVFVNNAKISSQDIESGPYRISNVPATAGSGTARVVVRDASGRETVTDLPFYVSSKLLASGFYDFSLEAGMPRVSYATPADAYVKQFVASGSGRTGVLDWLTLEGHAEAGPGLWNAGAGAVMRTGSFGVFSAALAGSRFDGKYGLQSYFAYEFGLLGTSIQLSSQRTFGGYDDLASATARLQAGRLPDQQTLLAGLSLANFSAPGAAVPGSVWVSARPAKALDRVSIALPLPFDLSTLSASFIHLDDASGKVSDILSASWSRSFGYNVTAFATAYSDIKDRKNCGFLIGLSIPLGDAAVASSGVSRDRNGSHVTLDAIKPLAQQPGSVGWRLHDGEGVNPDRSGTVAYRSDYARVEVGARQYGKTGQATAEIEGAVATMGNGIFLANRIDDSFAVVETGVPGVEVLHENRSVGFTDANGRALIPSLHSYQKNKISIDARNLPVDADVSRTEDIVAPGDRSGVQLDFRVRTSTGAAVLVLTGANGQPLPAGSQGKVEGGEAFVVGYDGRAFVNGLGAENGVTVDVAGGQCRGSFAYVARTNEQVVIPVSCQ